MITTTDRSKSFRKIAGMREGMTLPEVLIALALGGLLLAAAVGSLLFLAKTSKGLGNYQEMNMASRFTLEDFGSDARMAAGVNAASASSVSLEVYDSSGGLTTVSYRYDSDAGTLSRTTEGVVDVILKDVDGLSLIYYNLYGNPTTNLLEIKEIQLQAEMRRSVLSIKNTNEIISARFMMRNRTVSS